MSATALRVRYASQNSWAKPDGRSENMTKNEVHGAYEHWSMVIIYNPNTGDIVHTHQAVTTRGGQHPNRGALEKEAAEHAARARNESVESMAFLHVDPHEVE